MDALEVNVLVYCSYILIFHANNLWRLRNDLVLSVQ